MKLGVFLKGKGHPFPSYSTTVKLKVIEVFLTCGVSIVYILFQDIFICHHLLF